MQALSGRARILIPLVLVVAVVLLLVLRGCASHDDGPALGGRMSSAQQPAYVPGPRTTIGQPPVTPATQAALDVMKQALRAIYTWEPAVDQSRADAYARATPWLTLELARPNAPTARSWRGPGLQWDTWATKRVRVLAEVELLCEDCLPDEPNSVRRTALVQQIEQAPDGKRTNGERLTVYVIATLTAEGWRVSAMQIKY